VGTELFPANGQVCRSQQSFSAILRHTPKKCENVFLFSRWGDVWLGFEPQPNARLQSLDYRAAGDPRNRYYVIDCEHAFVYRYARRNCLRSWRSLWYAHVNQSKESSTVAHLFRMFYGIRRLITVFTIGHWTKPDESTPHPPSESALGSSKWISFRISKWNFKFISCT